MFINQICDIISILEDLFWMYAGIPVLLSMGIYFTIKSRFFQIRQLNKVFEVFKSFAVRKTDTHERGVAPIEVFFTSLGGCVGVGNIIGACTAVQIGGPGAVFWMWISALFNMLVKYSEIFLGIKYRIIGKNNNYIGGPMIYLQRVPGGYFLAPLFAFLMCLYGVEIYQFRVVSDSISVGWGINYNIVIVTLLVLVLIAGQGGVRLVGRVSSIIIPIFLVMYSTLALWVFSQNVDKIAGVFTLIFSHAFTPHAAIGAFAGNTVLVAMSYGIRRSCYTGDIGVGYAATIHSESQEAVPARQACLGIIDIILDTYVVCTTTLFLILITDTWHQGISENFLVVTVLSKHFPFLWNIWPLFIFLLGYSNTTAFFTAGRKSALYLSPKYGSKIYIIFAACSYLFFSYVGSMCHCMAIMSIVGMLLLMINLYGIFYLHKEIVFNLKQK